MSDDPRAAEALRHRRVEVALRVSEQRFSHMLANVHLLAVMLDRRGRITYCNEFMLRLTGWRAEEVVGNDWFTLFVPPDQRDGARRRFADCLCDELAATHAEEFVMARSGERFRIRWSRVVLRSACGEVAGCSAIGEDVTERHRAEVEIQSLNAELERRVTERTAELEAANRELEAFDYSVSHDLRAPLRHMQGFSRLLLAEHASQLDETGRDYLRRIVEAGRRMDELVSDLLRLSTVTRGELHRCRVDISELATDVLDELRRRHPERKVQSTVEAGLRTFADAGLVRTVLDNLVGNSWKFTRPRKAARIEVGSMATPRGRAFFVRDNGVGFDMAHAGRLFAPLRRLHAQSEFEGTGLGLATVERVVRRHGGRAWGEGAPNDGATFYFTLAPAA